MLDLEEKQISQTRSSHIEKDLSPSKRALDETNCVQCRELVKQTLCNRDNHIMCIVGFMLISGMLSFGSLWAIPFFGRCGIYHFVDTD